MKKWLILNFLGVFLLISLLSGCGGGGGGGNSGGNGDGNDGNGKPISYENYSFEYLLNGGSGYQVAYTYARNGLKSLQMYPDGTGLHIELATGVTTHFKDGKATRYTDSNNIKSNLLTSLGVIGSGRIGERIGGETLDANFCDIVKLPGSGGVFCKIWYCKKFDIALKFETYADDKLQSGFYLKKFQLGNCSEEMVRLPEGLDISDLDATAP